MTNDKSIIYFPCRKKKISNGGSLSPHPTKGEGGRAKPTPLEPPYIDSGEQAPPIAPIIEG